MFGHVAQDVELRILCKDGEYRWFRLRGNAERDETGVALRVSGSIHEIERQKAAEDALREAQARFERAIDGTQDGLWEVDMRSGKMWLSPRLHELLGYTVGELHDRHDVLRELVHPDDVTRSDEAVARQGDARSRPSSSKCECARKSGDVSLVPIPRLAFRDGGRSHHARLRQHAGRDTMQRLARRRARARLRMRPKPRTTPRARSSRT